MLALSVLQMNLTRNFRDKNTSLLEFPSSTSQLPSFNYSSDCRKRHTVDDEHHLSLLQNAKKTRTEIFVPILKRIFQKITKIVDTKNKVKLIYQLEYRQSVRLTTSIAKLPAESFNCYLQPQKFNWEVIFIVFLFKNDLFDNNKMVFTDGGADENRGGDVDIDVVDGTLTDQIDTIEMTTEIGCRIFRGQNGIHRHLPEKIKELKNCFPLSEFIITNKFLVEKEGEKNNNKSENTTIVGESSKKNCLQKMIKKCGKLRRTKMTTTATTPKTSNGSNHTRKTTNENLEKLTEDTLPQSKSIDTKRRKRRKKSNSSHHLPIAAVASGKNVKAADELQQKKRKKKVRKCQRNYERDEKLEYRQTIDIPLKTCGDSVESEDKIQTSTCPTAPSTNTSVESNDNDSESITGDVDEVDCSPSPKMQFIFPNTNPNIFSTAFLCSVHPPRMRQRQISECSNDSIDICFMSDFEDESDNDLSTNYRRKTCPSDTDSDSGLLDERKVRFNLKPEVRVIRTWDFAHRQARKGNWEEIARDRFRFNNRICDVDKKISWVFNKDHRDNIFLNRFDNDNHTEKVK